jgi:predicted solute-binding protein
MSPERRRIIGEHKVEEYYWSREYPVYIDNQLTAETFEEACARLEAEAKEGEEAHDA